MTDIDTSEVADVVERALAVRVTDVQLFAPHTSSRRTFEVSLSTGRSVVAKVSATEQSMGPVAHNLEVLRRLGLPVPQVLAVDMSQSVMARDVLVMNRIPGRDLGGEIADMTPGQLSEVARFVVDCQRRVATLPVVGRCGFVPIGVPGTRSWDDVVQRPNGYRFADPPPADTADLLAKLRTTLVRLRPQLAAIPPVCFLDDLTTKNVLVEDGRVTGIVDFDVICQGDARFHLGLTAAAVTVLAAPHGPHYLEELNRYADVDDDDRAYVDLYSAAFLINFLGAESPDRPGTWRGLAATAADAALRRVNAS